MGLAHKLLGPHNIYIYIYIYIYKALTRRNSTNKIFLNKNSGKITSLVPSRGSLETKGKFKASKKISYEYNLKVIALL